MYEDDEEESDEDDDPIDWWEFWRDVDEGDPLLDQMEDERETAEEKVSEGLAPLGFRPRPWLWSQLGLWKSGIRSQLPRG